MRDGTSANTNFGSAAELQVKNTANFNREAFLKFDLANVATINNAKLRLFGRLSGTEGTNVRTEVFSVADSGWGESTITHNNRPASGATALAGTVVTDTVGRYYEFDLTSYLKAEKVAGRRFVIVVLKNPAASQPFVTFNSREAAGDRPQLVIS